MTPTDTNDTNDTADRPTDDTADRPTDEPIVAGDPRTEQTGSVPPPPPPPPPRAGRWQRTPVARDPDRGKVGGVIAGISRSFGFDLRTTRIAVVVATIVLPVLIAVYGAAWLLLPDRPEAAKPLVDVLRDRRRLPLVIAIAIVVLAGGLGSFRSWFLFGGIPWGLGLIAVGGLLWAAPGILDDRRQHDGSGPAADHPSSDPWSAPASTVPFGGPVPADQSWGAPRPSDATRGMSLPPVVEPQRRKRYPVNAIGFLAAVTFVVVGAGGDALDWWNLPILSGVIVTVAILWASHLLSGIVNRRWSVIPGLVFLGAAAAGLIVTTPNLDGGIGKDTVRPVNAAEAGIHQHLGIGELIVDLTRVADAPDTMTVEAEVGVGRLRILVPADAVLQLRSSVGAGHLVVDGHEIVAGVRHDDQRANLPAGSAASGDDSGVHAPTIVLDVEIGVGEISIERIGAAA